MLTFSGTLTFRIHPSPISDSTNTTTCIVNDTMTKRDFVKSLFGRWLDSLNWQVPSKHRIVLDGQACEAYDFGTKPRELHFGLIPDTVLCNRTLVPYKFVLFPKGHYMEREAPKRLAFQFDPLGEYKGTERQYKCMLKLYLTCEESLQFIVDKPVFAMGEIV